MYSDTLEQLQPAEAETERPGKILIIDDDAALADVLSQRLQSQGFRTLTADSGRAGLDTARCEVPSLVVLDLCLPDIDGFSVCEQLADAPETCGIPVIILSGLQRPDILRRCRAVGCHYFLRKPYDPNVLLTLVRQAIEDTRGWDSVARSL